jgi:serine/threonine-protein kinase
MEVLSTITHPNIVKFVEHGRSEQGRVYLVMEYLPGESLRARCTRATRLSPIELQETLLALAGALCSLHPDEARIDAIRRKDEITPADLQEIEAARHGFVHRDIKPENIILVPGRGPVLIDFNIASEIGDNVRTSSHTPGYLPPDGLPPRWSVDVDLYALGVSVLQAAVGIEYDGRNLADLRNTTEQEVSIPLRGILLKLSEGASSRRFLSARELMGVLRESN